MRAASGLVFTLTSMSCASGPLQGYPGMPPARQRDGPRSRSVRPARSSGADSTLCGKVTVHIATEGSNCMARPGPQTHAKRQREQAKKEKRKAKEEKKALRKAEKMASAEPGSI